MDAKVRKACNMWACRRPCSVRWGPRPRVVYWLYVSVVRPPITFASLVWWPGCETARAKPVKHNPKAHMPGDHGSDANYSHQCGGDTCWSPCAGLRGRG
jgi:hypothetical protein